MVVDVDLRDVNDLLVLASASVYKVTHVEILKVTKKIIRSPSPPARHTAAHGSMRRAASLRLKTITEQNLTEIFSVLPAMKMFMVGTPIDTKYFFPSES